MFIEYQPFHIKGIEWHPICTMTYGTKEEAIAYAKSRGIPDREIGVKKQKVVTKYKREF